MVSINYAFKEIISKIVYYGPGLSGKTTNLQHVFKKVPNDTRGELISLATDADRTLYFDFLPVNVGNIRGFQVKFQLYTPKPTLTGLTAGTGQPGIRSS